MDATSSREVPGALARGLGPSPARAARGTGASRGAARSARAPRWPVIDAARGSALIAVCVSHFALTYFARSPGSESQRLLQVLGLVATPTFLLVSGLVLGFLGAGRPSAALRRRFLDRGVFLLVVAHAVIVVAHLPFVGGLRETLHWEFVTDTIAVCVVLGPGVVLGLGPLQRLAAAAAVYALSWVVVSLPAWPGWPGSARELLFGAFQLAHVGVSFPVIPWLCVYVAATPLGERIRALRDAGDDAAVVRVLARLALGSLGVGVLGLGLHRILPHLPAFAGQHFLVALTAAGQKLPPGPVYLALEGGLGLALLALFGQLERRGWLTGLARGVSAVGRSSLFGFVVQYFVYYSAVTLIRPVPSAWWPAWLVLSVALVAGAATAWDRWQLNRLFTVGISPPSGVA
jgi:hypothetical protein